MNHQTTEVKEQTDMLKTRPNIAYIIYIIVSIILMVIFPIYVFTSNQLLGIFVGLLVAQVINYMFIGAED